MQVNYKSFLTAFSLPPVWIEIKTAKCQMPIAYFMTMSMNEIYYDDEEEGRVEGKVAAVTAVPAVHERLGYLQKLFSRMLS